MKQKFLIHLISNTHDYSSYGIQIPLLNSRVDIPFSKAQKKYDIQTTLIPNEIKISVLDLYECHTTNFVEEFLSNPEELVIKTYELRDADGNWKRYTPSSENKPLSQFTTKAISHATGTYLACLNALEAGFCYHLGGGMHHAMSFRPGGFCMINDMVIAIRKLQKLGLIKKAIIIDMDAHKGDGTAQITLGDETIKTYSIHMQNGWPLDDEKNIDSFIPSDLDVGVLPTDDYLSVFKESVSSFINSNIADTDLCIVVHGSDVFELDALESSSLIKLSQADVLERDKFIFEKLKDLDLSQSWVMAGGYGEHTHEVIWQFIDYALDKYLPSTK